MPCDDESAVEVTVVEVAGEPYVPLPYSFDAEAGDRVLRSVESGCATYRRQSTG
jgi:Na+-transporting NADH:ubiquinone oxidoreductase subunit NqrA